MDLDYWKANLILPITEVIDVRSLGKFVVQLIFGTFLWFLRNEKECSFWVDFVRFVLCLMVPFLKPAFHPHERRVRLRTLPPRTAHRFWHIFSQHGDPTVVARLKKESPFVLRLSLASLKSTKRSCSVLEVHRSSPEAMRVKVPVTPRFKSTISLQNVHPTPDAFLWTWLVLERLFVTGFSTPELLQLFAHIDQSAVRHMWLALNRCDWRPFRFLRFPNLDSLWIPGISFKPVVSTKRLLDYFKSVNKLDITFKVRKLPEPNFVYEHVQRFVLRNQRATWVALRFRSFNGKVVGFCASRNVAFAFPIIQQLDRQSEPPFWLVPSPT